ncbi:MAG TPA: beta-ketoacyl-[acyl-carrier-protein] synthase family protein, partial [Usitatibacter sp.]|nr:beta-ketoacyl-[acyl-carrier-protein] synthase family protein [Usitatibacter sp.]
MRVVVTGVGAVSPLALGAQPFFSALREGRSAVGRLDADPASPLATRIGAPVRYDVASRFEPAKRRMLDRVSQFALLAAAEALGQSRGALEGVDPAHACVLVGTGMGGAEATDDGYRTLYGEKSDRIKPFSVLLAMNNAAAAWIGLEHGITGPNLTYSTACSSSAVAIGEAFRRVARGESQVAIAGGAEAPLTYGTLRAWEALRTLASEDPADASASCKPFARDRSGLVLGEGAAMVVLEPRERALARGATILAEIVGYGLCTDASHITRPSVEGQARAMRLALEDARLQPADIGYINAHGTATAANDPVETAAIRAVLGARAHDVPVSSTKSMHGHLLGAAGALELVAALGALREGVVPPTMHLTQADPACDLDYVPGKARAVAGLEVVMSSS